MFNRVACLMLLSLALLTAGCRSDLEGHMLQAASTSSVRQSSAHLLKHGFSAELDANWRASSQLPSDRNWPLTISAPGSTGEHQILFASNYAPPRQADSGLALKNSASKSRPIYTFPPEGAGVGLDGRSLKDAIKNNIESYVRLVKLLYSPEDSKGLTIGMDREIKTRQKAARKAAYDALWKTRSSEQFCQTVVQRMVEDLLPRDFPFLQFGNCGEGGMVFACMARQYGLSDDDVKYCYSWNDHAFAMHKDPMKPDSWCLMDRWDLITDDVYYSCDLRYDPESHAILPMNSTKIDSSWFEKVVCKTLTQLAEDGGIHESERPSQKSKKAQ